mmetsp:Transcript_154174/g.287432  ORF Transcript_154174/g.287432 Transcript_154174/m.287432 type:complete len:490 (+) Transcript_154174:61-1530(+)
MTAKAPTEGPAEQARAALSEVVALVSRHSVTTCLKDNAMHVYGKVGGVAIYVQSQLLQTLEATKKRALEAFEYAVKYAEKYNSTESDILVGIRGWVSGRILHIQGVILEGSKIVQAKALVVGAHIDAAVRKIPLPAEYKDRLSVFVDGAVHRAEGASIYVKDGITHSYAQIGDAVVHVKSKAVGSFETSKATALTILERARPVVEKYLTKLCDDSIVAKGKIGDSVVQIRVRGAEAGAKASQSFAKMYSSLQEALQGLPLLSKDGVQILKSKAGNLAISAKDGFLYARGQFGAAHVYLKAAVIKGENSVKLHVVEAVTSAKARSRGTIDTAMVRAMDIYGNSKAAVGDKRVQLAVAGTLVGVSAGGAAGLSVGTTAGAACGLPFAVFTFGLSVPIGATIGGGAGTCVGAAAGGAVGLIGGGMAGYSSDQRAEIKQSILHAFDRVSDSKDYMREKAASSVAFVKARLAGSTGGTESAGGTESEASSLVGS